MTFEDEISSHREYLVNFAHKFTPNHAVCEDLAQETILRALEKKEQFQSGTNLKAWLVTILRNHFFSESRRRRVVFDSNKADNTLLETDSGIDSPQYYNLLFKQTLEAIAGLNGSGELFLEQVMTGLTVNDLANLHDIKIGTIKSRISRVREQLQFAVGNKEKNKKPSLQIIYPSGHVDYTSSLEKYCNDHHVSKSLARRSRDNGKPIPSGKFAGVKVVRLPGG